MSHSAAAVPKDRRTPWRVRVRRYAPPLVGVVVALVVIVLIPVALAPLNLRPDPIRLAIIEIALLVACGFVGQQLLRRSADTSTGRSWLEWEEPEGTTGSIPILYAVWVVTAWTMWRHFEWWPLVLGLLAAGIIAHILARPRQSAEPIVIVPDQLPPEPLADHELITLPWGLAPAQPEVKGEVSTWVRRSKVADFRPPKNPKSKWAEGIAGHQRPEYEWYVHEGRCDEINALADQLSAISAAHGLSRYSELCLVLDLVQSIEYRHDDDARFPVETRFDEYWRFPLETLYDRAGDCEDDAILTVALLSAMGHRTCFFDLPDHAAVGVTGLPDDSGTFVAAGDGAWFYFVETTADGWAIGQLPKDVNREQLSISAIVEPFAHRKEAPALSAMPKGTWRRQNVLILATFAGLAVVGSLLALAL